MAIPEDTTVFEAIEYAWQRANAVMDTCDGAGKREIALAKTALEDAQMRFTRGLAKDQGKFAPKDLERAS